MAKLKTKDEDSEGSGDWWKLPLAVATGGIGAMPLKKSLERQEVKKHGAKLDEDVRSRLAELRETAELADQRLYDNLIKQGIDQSAAQRIVGEAGSSTAMEASRKNLESAGGRAGAKEIGAEKSLAAIQKERTAAAKDRLAHVADEALLPKAGEAAKANQLAEIAQSIATQQTNQNTGMAAQAERPYIPDRVGAQERFKTRAAEFNYSTVPDPEQERAITRDMQRARAVKSGSAPITARFETEADRLDAQDRLDPKAREFSLKQKRGDTDVLLPPGYARLRPGGTNYLNTRPTASNVFQEGMPGGIFTGDDIFSKPSMSGGTGPRLNRKGPGSPGMMLDPGAPSDDAYQRALEELEARRLRSQMGGE